MVMHSSNNETWKNIEELNEFKRFILQKLVIKFQLKHMSISENFQDNSKQSFTEFLPRHKTSLEYSSSQLESKYLDQFFQKGVLSSENQIISLIGQNQQNIEKREQKIPVILSRKESKVKSKFHNFQKHLIITLRKSVNISKHFLSKDDLSLQQLWEVFCQKRTYNKSLLRILFGQNMIEEQLNKKLFKKEGFKSIIDRYPVDEIIEAQHSLRKIVLDHFQSSHLDSVLEDRKLPEKTKQLFKKYLNEFITELKQGHVMKRLPKSKKASMLLLQ